MNELIKAFPQMPDEIETALNDRSDIFLETKIRPALMSFFESMETDYLFRLFYQDEGNKEFLTELLEV